MRRAQTDLGGPTSASRKQSLAQIGAGGIKPAAQWLLGDAAGGRPAPSTPTVDLLA